MEQRKSDINTDDGNVVNVDTNGLSYSFDFSSQVAPENGGTSMAAPGVVTPEMPDKPNVDVAAPVAPAPFQPVEPVAPAAPVEPVAVEPVAPAAPVEPVAVEPVAPVASVEPVAVEPVAPVASVEPVAVEPVAPAAPVEPVAVEPVAPVAEGAVTESADATATEGTEVVAPAEEVKEETKTEETEEVLIKDKKATKSFLIFIFVIVVAFIIALPFIFKMIG